MTTVDPLDPGLLDGLPELSLEQIRERRAACEALETQLSYVRRLAQGRMDILAHEIEVRRSGARAGGGDVVEELKEALGGHLVAPGLGHLPTVMAPGDIDAELLARLDEVAPPGRLTGLHECDEAELVAAIEALGAYEHELSERRREMFARIDALKDEIVRRYRSGEASVDRLLDPAPRD